MIKLLNQGNTTADRNDETPCALQHGSLPRAALVVKSLLTLAQRIRKYFPLVICRKKVRLNFLLSGNQVATTLHQSACSVNLPGGYQ